MDLLLISKMVGAFAGAITTVAAAVFAARKIYHWLLPIRIQSSYRLGGKTPFIDEIRATITNVSRETQFVVGCKARGTYSYWHIVKRHLRHPLTPPRLYANIRYFPLQFDLLGDGPLKLEPAQPEMLIHRLRDHPLSAMRTPYFFIEAKLSSGKTVKSKRMEVPLRWKTLGSDVSTLPTADHWANRMRLEISVIANVSVGRESTESPINKEPEISRLRELKDAIDTGILEAQLNGEKPNVMSTVTLENFEKFVTNGNKQYWVEVVRRWQAAHAPSGADLTEVLKEKRISLLQFIEIAGRHGWPILDPGGYGGFDLIHGISESAGLGDLVVLGKEIDSQLPGMVDANRRERIPAEVWKHHEIDAMSCFTFTNPGIVIGLAGNNKETKTKGDRGDLTEPPNYKDLYLETEGLMDWLKNDADQYRGFFQETYGD